MNKIDGKKWYSVQEIVDQNLLPFLDTGYKIKRWIEGGYIKGNTVGKGNGKRYFVKGTALITFLAKWEAGDFR